VQSRGRVRVFTRCLVVCLPFGGGVRSRLSRPGLPGEPTYRSRNRWTSAISISASRPLSTVQCRSGGSLGNHMHNWFVAVGVTATASCQIPALTRGVRGPRHAAALFNIRWMRCGQVNSGAIEVGLEVNSEGAITSSRPGWARLPTDTPAGWRVRPGHSLPTHAVYIGGFSVVGVRSRDEALNWAAKIAVACRCAQEVREFVPGSTV